MTHEKMENDDDLRIAPEELERIAFDDGWGVIDPELEAFMRENGAALVRELDRLMAEQRAALMEKAAKLLTDGPGDRNDG